VPIHDLAQDPERLLAALIRTEPTQERSAARIDALLDAAAVVVDEVGFDRLTTAMVAERANASIGTVYRYFPDRIALLQGLRERTDIRYRRVVADRIGAEEPPTWLAALGCSLDVFIEMYRNEPGFRIVRFVDEERGNSVEPGFDGGPQGFARAFGRVLADDFGFPLDDLSEFRLATAIEIADVLVSRAFAASPGGEQRYLDEARAVVGAYLARYYG